METTKYLQSVDQSNEVTPPSTGSSTINVGNNERIISVASGALLTVLGLKNFSRGGAVWTAVGGALLFRGATGYCPANALMGRNTAEMKDTSLQIKRSLTVNKPRNEVYSFWRQLENLPRFMTHLTEVNEIDAKRSKWVAKIPGNVGSVSWEAEIVEERANELLSWQSLPGSSVDNAGEINFKDAPGGRGTEIHALITYRAPAGDVGKAIAKLLNPVFEQLIKNDLRHFKQVIETGELPTIEGQTSGRQKDQEKAMTIKQSSRTEEVDDLALVEK